jgi:hypothetical protein
MRSLPPSRGKQPPKPGASRPPQPGQKPSQFKQLQASLLYCPKCRQATPTREILLLILPDGNLYDYRCAHCGTSTGSRTDRAAAEVRIVPG